MSRWSAPVAEAISPPSLNMPYVPPKDPTVVENWDEMPRDATILRLNGHQIADFAPLREFRKLKELFVSCKTIVQYEKVAELATLQRLSLTFVSKNVFPIIKSLTSLDVLVLDRYEGQSTEGIEALSSLRELSLLDCNKLCDISAISKLTNLEKLHISTPTSWDASRKVLSVPSLEPLSSLTGILSITLRGVEPRDRSLKPLEALHGLRELEISHVYSFQIEDYARLAAYLPKTKGHCLVPYYHMNVKFPCKKCGSEEVCLTGSAKGAKRWLCPRCHAQKLEAHTAKFEALREQANKT